MKSENDNLIRSRLLLILRQPYTIALMAVMLATFITIRSAPLYRLASRKALDTNKLYLRVTNASGTPITHAVVMVADNQLTTDELGVVKIDAKSGKQVDARIVAEGYARLDLSVTLPRSNPNITAVLTPVGKVEIAPPQPYAITVRSGPRPSGIGSGFSPWYELVSPPPEDGYVIDMDNTQFLLSGDRRCNEWSECQLRVVSAAQVVFMFRMQGHSEWFPPKPALSEGILRVQFKPVRR
jgi:hypothetical protein